MPTNAISSPHPLLEPAVRAKVLEAIGLGAPMHIAAAAAGVHERTLQRALARGRDGDPRYAALVEAMAQAEAESATTALQVVRAAALGGQWQAAAWLLERRWPDDYGRRDRQDVRVSGTIDVGRAEERLAELVGAAVVSQAIEQRDDEEP